MPLVQSRLDNSGERVVITQRTLYVAFGGCQVAIYSKIPEVNIWIERRFCEMLEPEPTRIVRRLRVFKKGENYHLLGNSKGSLEGRSLKYILKHLYMEVIHHLIQANPNLLWLHAGAAVYRGYTLLFLGPWGRGKSTLVTSLCEYGWTYISDDIAPLDVNTGKVIPFSQTPAVRENPGQEIPLHRLGKLRKNYIGLKKNSICREPMPIGAFIFPIYSHRAETRILPYSPATSALEILQCCLNFRSHQESAVRYICNLVKPLPASRVYFSNGKLAAKLINRTYENW